MSEDLTKLPKWAQRKIRVLESDLAAAKAKLNDGPDGSRVILDPYSDFARPVGDPLVRFQYLDGQYIDVGFRGDVLTASAGDMLLVGPSAWNVVRLIPGKEIRGISGV